MTFDKHRTVSYVMNYDADYQIKNYKEFLEIQYSKL